MQGHHLFQISLALLTTGVVYKPPRILIGEDALPLLKIPRFFESRSFDMVRKISRVNQWTAYRQSFSGDIGCVEFVVEGVFPPAHRSFLFVLVGFRRILGDRAVGLVLVAVFAGLLSWSSLIRIGWSGHGVVWGLQCLSLRVTVFISLVGVRMLILDRIDLQVPWPRCTCCGLRCQRVDAVDLQLSIGLDWIRVFGHLRQPLINSVAVRGLHG